MPTEDLTTYTISPDPLVYTTVTTDRSSVALLPRSVDELVYSDKGANHFDGDYEHLLDVLADALEGTGICFAWALTNLVDDAKGIRDASGDYNGLFFLSDDIYIEECNNGSLTYDSYNSSLDTTYYLKIKRDEGVGTYGTLYCYVYSDAERTTLLDTLTVTLTEKQDFRYVYVTQSFNDGYADHKITVYCENLDLKEVTAKTSSDTGSGADAKKTGEPLATLFKAEAGSGAGASSLVAAIIGTGETGLGLEFASKVFSAFDSGSGVEVVIARLLAASEIGSSVEVALLITVLSSGDGGLGSDLGTLLKAILAVDESSGFDALRALIETTGTDMRLPAGLGQVRIPSKEVNL